MAARFDSRKFGRPIAYLPRQSAHPLVDISSYLSPPRREFEACAWRHCSIMRIVSDFKMVAGNKIKSTLENGHRAITL